MLRLKTLMIGLLVACMASVTFAQKMSAEQRAERQVAQLNEVIPDLSAKQKEQLKAANLKQMKEMRAFREERTASQEPTPEEKEAARKKMQTLNKERQEAYKNILTEVQFNKYQEWNAENRKKGPKGKKGKKKAKSS